MNVKDNLLVAITGSDLEKKVDETLALTGLKIVEESKGKFKSDVEDTTRISGKMLSQCTKRISRGCKWF